MATTRQCFACKKELSNCSFSKTQIKKKKTRACCKSCIEGVTTTVQVKDGNSKNPAECQTDDAKLRLSPTSVFDHPICISTDDREDNTLSNPTEKNSNKEEKVAFDECMKLLVKVFVADGETLSKAICNSENVLKEYKGDEKELLKELKEFKVKKTSAEVEIEKNDVRKKAVESTLKPSEGKKPVSKGISLKQCMKLYAKAFPKLSESKRERKLSKMLSKPDVELQDIYKWLKEKLSNNQTKRDLSGRMDSRDSPMGQKRKRQQVNCDRCDGNHESEKCPYYKKPRENHPDAQRHRQKKSMGSSGGNKFIPSHKARIKRQPGDGSCLYHAMSYGLSNNTSAKKLRKELAYWVLKNETSKISDAKVRDWIKWDAGSNVKSYTRRMLNGSWGGGIEMAACSKLYRVNVHVYESSRGRRGYKRISCFDTSGARKTVNVLYCGGIHYDALVIPQQKRR